MKKLLLLGFLILTACGTNENGGQNRFVSSTRDVSKKAIETGYQTVVIEGCEYIYYSESQGYSGYGFMAHKGNCKNPIHQPNPKWIGDIHQITAKANTISIDSIKAQIWKEYREKLNPAQQKIESLIRNADIEMIKAQIQVQKAKAKRDSIEYVYGIKIN